jgi:hypothetical protein
MNAPDPTHPRIRGQAHALFAVDLGFQIDLDAAQARLRQATRQRVVRSRRPAPAWFEYSPPPLQVTVEGPSIAVGGTATDGACEALVYDFGAALLTYRLPLPEDLACLPQLGHHLYEHAELEADVRDRARRLIATLGPAIERPELGDALEDYTIFVITDWDPVTSPAQLVTTHGELLARAIEAEQQPLAPEQAERCLVGCISYTPGDLALIDWNGAVLFDREPEDVIAVLQHANVELLELRILDQELDAILDHADETLRSLIRRRLWPDLSAGRMLDRVATAQTDAAVLFEGVNNAIKLVGNQYLARLYRLAAERLALPAWHASVEHKLGATESLYQKMSDATSTRRLETLEWVIVILIAISILLPFTPWYH